MRTLTVTIVALTCLWTGGIAAAAPMKLRSVRPVSGPTPFSACPMDAPPPFTENEWQPKDTALEPHFAVDPRDPRRMAAAWMQDFTQGIVVAWTHDGGRTWARSVPPMLSLCTGSEGASADPRLSYGPDGVLYLSSMRNIKLGAGRTTPNSEVAVSASPDGGRTWRGPTRVIVADTYNDYPSVAADPDVPGRVYLTYTRATEPFGNALSTMFAVSDDGARTFTPPREIYNTGRTGFYTSGQLVAQRGGRLLLALWVFDGVNYLPGVPPLITSKVLALASSDGGRSWAKPVTLGEQLPEKNVTDPESGVGVSSGNVSVAAAPDGGFYVTWPDIDGPRSRVNLVRGRADGSWNEPREVLPWADRQILFPMVAVTPAGTVGLMWFDTRNDRPQDGSYIVDAYFGESRDHGATFSELHVAGPMDLRRAWSDARSFNGESDKFIGDYLGFAGRPKGFVATLPLTAPLAEVGKSQLFVADVGEPAAKNRKKTKPKPKRKRSRRKR